MRPYPMRIAAQGQYPTRRNDLHSLVRRTSVLLSRCSFCRTPLLIEACGPGEHCPEGSVEAVQCSAGSYSDDATQPCKPCGAGTHQPSKGKARCEPCNSAHPPALCPAGASRQARCTTAQLNGEDCVLGSSTADVFVWLSAETAGESDGDATPADSPSRHRGACQSCKRPSFKALCSTWFLALGVQLWM